MGEKALHSHADGKKHKKKLEDHEQVKNLFKPKLKTLQPVIITTPDKSMLAAG